MSAYPHIVGGEQDRPTSLHAEMTILGAMQVDESALVEAQGALQAWDFAIDSHRRIFKCFCALSSQSIPVDIVTASDFLKKSRELDSVGGLPYLASLTEGLPRKLSIESYVRIVREMSALRQTIDICENAIARAKSGQDESASILGGLQDGMQTVLDDGNTADEPLVKAYSVRALENYERERKLITSPGLSYGMQSLNEFTGGMRPGEVTIVGARSGVGKTSLMCQAAVANCIAGKPVHLFSLEMTREQILRRLWAIVSGVAYKRITDPWLSNIEDVERVKEAMYMVAEWPLRIHDQSELHLSKIIGLARLSMSRYGTQFVAVDYAQEVEADGRDERMKVMAVAKGLSRMIKHENASLMLLSQLVKINRESYNKPPIVGDLIESGKLENVAHIVLLLHRGWDEEASRVADEAEIIIPKQRRGETGVIPAHFNRKSVTFEARIV